MQVYRDHNRVPLADVVAEVNGVNTTDDWAGWISKHRANEMPGDQRNMWEDPTLNPTGVAYDPTWRQRIAISRQLAEQLAKEGIYFEAGAGLYVSPSKVAMAGAAFIRRGRRAASLGRFSRAAEFGIQPYNKLVKETAGTGLQAHHLIEQRFAKILGVNPNTMEAIALKPAEHQAFTNAWRQAIGYKGGSNPLNTLTATRQQIMNAAREIYKDYPDILRALGL